MLYKDITNHNIEHPSFQLHRTKSNTDRTEKLFMCVNMANSDKMLAALFFFAIASSTIFVNADFSKSMYITWGAQHAIMQGDDLQLVLDQTSGCIQFTLFQKIIIYLSLNCNRINLHLYSRKGSYIVASMLHIVQCFAIEY